MGGPRDPPSARRGTRYATSRSIGGERSAAIHGILVHHLIRNHQPLVSMATLSERLSLNAPGRFFVDSSCIDCDQCRVEAPDVFARDPDQGTSYVKRQPITPDEIAATEAAVANCATGSIGEDAG